MTTPTNNPHDRPTVRGGLSPVYLQGASAPLNREIDLEDLPIDGDLPPDLDGWLYLIGPDLIGAPSPSGHRLIGDGMVHGVQLRDRRAVRYRSRWVRTGPTATKLGAPAPAGPPPAHDLFDQANGSVFAFAGHLLATSETCLPYRLSADLNTLGRLDVGVAGGLRAGFGAHPKIDPRTGDLHTITYQWDESPHLLHHHIGADGRWISTVGIDVPACTVMHDMALTERYAVFFDLPARWDYALQFHGYDFPVVWDPDHRARIGVLTLAGGAIRWFDIDSCFVFHTFNAYEKPARTRDAEPVIVLDAVRHRRAFGDSLETPDSPFPAVPVRWELDLAAGRVSETTVSDETGLEYPQIDSRRRGLPYRHGYAAGVPGRDGEASFVKVDVRSGRLDRHGCGPGTGASEPLFVPARDGRDDDEGWLVGTVYHADTDTSEVVVVDAHDVSGPPRARIRLPHRIPAGFHGAWISTDTTTRPRLTAN